MLIHDALWRLVFIKHLCKCCPRLTHLVWDKYIHSCLALFLTSKILQEQHSVRANLIKKYSQQIVRRWEGFFLASAQCWNIYRAISQRIVQTAELFTNLNFIIIVIDHHHCHHHHPPPYHHHHHCPSIHTAPPREFPLPFSIIWWLKQIAHFIITTLAMKIHECSIKKGVVDFKNSKYSSSSIFWKKIFFQIFLLKCFDFFF